MPNKIDKYGLCLEEYTSNKNNADVYFKRAMESIQKWKFLKLYQNY